MLDFLVGGRPAAASGFTMYSGTCLGRMRIACTLHAHIGPQTVFHDAGAMMWTIASFACGRNRRIRTEGRAFWEEAFLSGTNMCTKPWEVLLFGTNVGLSWFVAALEKESSFSPVNPPIILQKHTAHGLSPETTPYGANISPRRPLRPAADGTKSPLL